MLWARFFGELYKYELIKRNFLYEKLSDFIAIRNNEEPKTFTINE